MVQHREPNAPGPSSTAKDMSLIRFSKRGLQGRHFCAGMSPPESTCPKGSHAADLMAGGGEACEVGGGREWLQSEGPVWVRESCWEWRGRADRACGPGKVSARHQPGSEPGTPIRGSPRQAGMDFPAPYHDPQGLVWGRHGLR